MHASGGLALLTHNSTCYFSLRILEHHHTRQIFALQQFQ